MCRLLKIEKNMIGVKKVMFVYCVAGRHKRVPQVSGLVPDGVAASGSDDRGQLLRAHAAERLPLDRGGQESQPARLDAHAPRVLAALSYLPSTILRALARALDNITVVIITLIVSILLVNVPLLLI